MNEDLNMISNIWRFVFLKKGLINGLFAQCKLFWVIIKFASDDVIILVAVIVKSLELKSGWREFKPSLCTFKFLLLKNFFHKLVYFLKHIFTLMKKKKKKKEKENPLCRNIFLHQLLFPADYSNINCTYLYVLVQRVGVRWRAYSCD